MDQRSEFACLVAFRRAFSETEQIHSSGADIHEGRRERGQVPQVWILIDKIVEGLIGLFSVLLPPGCQIASRIHISLLGSEWYFNTVSVLAVPGESMGSRRSG